MAAGKEIKRLRGKLAASKAAAFIGVDPEKLRKWEQRDVDPKDYADILAVEHYFGCHIKDLSKLDNFQFSPKPTNGALKEADASYGKAYLEESVKNLSETEKINARNIERLISLLEFKIGFVGQPDLPEPGTPGTVAIGKEKTGHKGRQ